MNIKDRIRISLLLEKISKNKTYSKKLGLEDVSTLRGKSIYQKEEQKIC